MNKPRPEGRVTYFSIKMQIKWNWQELNAGIGDIFSKNYF
jgi:hypothetical protein